MRVLNWLSYCYFILGSEKMSPNSNMDVETEGTTTTTNMTSTTTTTVNTNYKDDNNYSDGTMNPLRMNNIPDTDDTDTEKQTPVSGPLGFLTGTSSSPEPKPETVPEPETRPEEPTEPTERDAYIHKPPDGGREAWLVILGNWCTMFCSFGWINSMSTLFIHYIWIGQY